MSWLSKESALCSVASTSQEDPEEGSSASASIRTLNVTLLSSEWKSTKGGVSTISRELAIQLAKHPNVEVSVCLPKCSEEDKRIAASHSVQLIEAKELPGYEAVDWLAYGPENHAMDCIIGHGVHLGRQIPLIKRHNHHCKWIQIVYTVPEELGMYKTYEDAIAKGEKKHQTEVRLCEMADQVVAVGPKLADAYSRCLRPCQKNEEVFTLTPGIFTEFSEVKQATEEGNNFFVLVFGRGDSEDFELKGYDIAVQALAELKDTSYQLMFVGAPAGKEGEVADRLLQHGIPRSQLTVRSFKESRDQLAKLFCEVDLAIMPSRTEGFGLTALEALSSGLPVLVSGNSGLGVALKEVVYGSQCVVDSEDPKEWAKKIKAVRNKKREVRLEESKLLRSKYLEKFKWQESCGLLLKEMQNLVFGSSETKGKKDKRPLPPFDNHPSKRPRRELSDRKELPRQMFKNLQQMQHHDVGKVFSKDALLARLERIVSKKGFVISDNEGSGNCMFYALCEQLHLVKGITISPEKLRQSIVQYLRKNPKLPDGTDLFNFINGYPSWADYLTNMEQDGTWGDHIILLAVANCYETYIHVISSQSDYNDVTIRPDRHVVHTNPLVLGHIHEVHYVSLRPKQGPSGYGSPLKSVQYNQFPVSPVTQSSTPAYYTSHPQSPARIPAQPSEHGKRSSPSGTWVPNQKRLLTREDKESSERGTSATSPNQHRLSTDSDTGHGLSTFLSILKAEYNRRSLLKPLLWDNTFKLPLEEVYTRLSIVSRRKTDFKLESGEVNLFDVFKFLNKGEDTMVLVEGSPGIGKTTFCLKISHDWTNEKIPNDSSFAVFKLLLLLKCRDIHGDVMEAISEQLLPEDTDEKITKEIMDYIKDIHNQKKILIILDGLDELPKTAESHVDKLLYRRILPFCYVLGTSRQETGIIVRQKVDFDILLQIEGFREQDAFEYIRKHFSHLDSSNLSKGERLIEAIQENTLLHALLSNPLNLLLLCVVFEDYQGELPSFRTELYQVIVRCLLRRYCAKHNLKAPGDDQSLEKQFEDSSLVLGELAWRCLLEDRFSFREEELAIFENKIKDLAARKLGLVFKEASVKRINPQHEYHFFHKTFQEYMAATYLSHKLLREELNLFLNLKFYDITVKYRQVFLFVSGILGKDASVLFNQIGEMLKSEHWDWLNCSKQEATFFLESFNESCNAEQMAMTLCTFIPFPLTVEIKLLADTVYQKRDKTTNTSILMVAEACRNFPQLQHPVHLTVQISNHLDDGDLEMVAKFLESCPKLETFSCCMCDSSLITSGTALFEGLSKNSTISSFTFQATYGISLDWAVIIGNSLAANKTLRTVTFELVNECNEAWASALERGLSADTPLMSVVLKIYGSLIGEAVGALKKILSNGSLSSLTLIIYGEMQDSLATAVGETLATESILKSLTLIVYGKISYSGAISLERGFLDNSALNSLEVKVFGELPDNWVTVVEKVLGAKKSKMSVAFHPNITGTISQTQVARLCPGFQLQSLTLNLWGELSFTGIESLCNLLVTSSTPYVTLNVHGKVTNNVAKCVVSYLKPCQTLSSLSINIFGELTSDGNSVLHELACNGKYSFALNVCSVASRLNVEVDSSSSLISVFTKVEDTCTRILTLNTSDHRASEKWTFGLGGGLAKNTLTTLNLTFSNYSDIGHGHWGDDLSYGLSKNTSLTTLSLTFNNFTDMELGHLGDGLGHGLGKNTSLTMLSLTFNNFSDIGLRQLGDGLGHGLAKNTSLTTLSLTFNNCSDMGLGHFLDGLGDGLGKNTSLTTLSLTFNNCNGMAPRYWGNGPGHGLGKNTSLTTLNLTFNNYSDMAPRYWGGGLGLLGHGLTENTSLTTLSLTVNNWGDGIRDLLHSLQYGLAFNTSLTTFSLTLNNYTDLSTDWACGLGESLGRIKSLTVVSATINTYIEVSEEWLCALCDSLVQSSTITALSFTFNDHSGTSKVIGHDLRKHFADCKLSPSLNLTVSLYGEAAVS